MTGSCEGSLAKLGTQDSGKNEWFNLAGGFDPLSISPFARGGQKRGVSFAKGETEVSISIG